MVEAPCTMELSVFPMDRCTCTLICESYSFNVGKVRLNWKEHGPVQIFDKDKQQLPDFAMYNHTWEKNTFEYPPGVWDQLKIDFRPVTFF